MTRRAKGLLIAVAVACVVLAAAAAGVAAFAPSWLRGTVERAASRALGRELRIAGPFELTWSLTPTLTAGGITLANVPWGSEPAMVRLGRVAVSVDLSSLWSGPVRVREIIVEDARVLLEADGEGRGNWMLDLEPAGERPREPSAGRRLVFDRAAIRGFDLVYRRRPGSRPVRVGVTALEATLEQPTGMIDVRGGGSFNERPWEIAGRLGTLDRLLQGRDIDQTLAGRIGGAKLEIRGHVRDPLTLGDPDVTLSVDGPDIVAALDAFDLRSPLTGPFRLRGRFTPAKDGVAFDLEAALGDTRAAARGVVGALLAPGRIDARVEASGRDASEIGAWTKVRGLPPRPFELAGGVRLADKTLTLDNVAMRVGPTSLTVSGAIGPPPRCVGTSLVVAGSGKDLAELSDLAGVRLPRGPFEVRGRFLRRADGLALGPTEVRFKEALVTVEGAIGEPPGVPNLDLAVDASGPDLAVFSELATVELPAEPFVVRGQVARDGSAVVLHDVAGRLGDIGANLSGRLVPRKRMVGSDAEVHLAGPDLARLASFVKLGGVPAERFDAKGRVRIAEDGYELDGVEATVGRIAAAVGGKIGSPSVLDGTSLTCRARGPALSDLEVWGLPAKLPADPFSVSGKLRISEGTYRVTEAAAEIGADRLRVDGNLGPLPDLSQLDAVVAAAGPSLAELGRFLPAAGVEPPQRLPSLPYEVGGRVRRVIAGYGLEGVVATVGGTVLRVNGSLGAGSGLLGTDLRFEIEAPDTSLLSGLSDAAMPEGPFEARGRVARVGAGLLCDGVSVAIGDAHAEVSGTLGPWPTLEGTDLEARAAGPDLSATLGPPTGLESLPAAPFEVSAHLDGSIDRFESERFAARLGGSDLEGRVSMRLEGRPSFDAELRSNAIDVAELLAGFGEAPTDGPQPAATKKKKRKSDRKRDRLIPDDPLPLAALGTLDGTLRLTAARIAIPGLPLRDVTVTGELRGGTLRFDNVAGTGIYGGRAAASLAIEPSGEGWRVRAEGRLDGGRLAFPKAAAQAAEKAPSVDVEFDLKGEGGSLHQLATGSDGHLLVVVGPGEIPNMLSSGVTSDVLRGLLDALNPFGKSSDHTDFECGIASAAVTSGKAAVEPIAARTDKLTVIGRGKADLDTEAIDLVWTLKSRKGIGVSAGSIANPYVKLGGTLAHPSLDVKPLQAAASTGAAVATAGLTILFRSIYNRITAERKVCVDALEKARKQIEARASREESPPPVSPSP